MGLNYVFEIVIMREIHTEDWRMEDLTIAILALAIFSEVSVLTFMLMKEFFLPFVGGVVCDFFGKVRGRYGK